MVAVADVAATVAAAGVTAIKEFSQTKTAGSSNEPAVFVKFSIEEAQRMDVGDFLHFGLELNAAPTKEDVELLLQRLGNWPEDAERTILLQAAQNRLRGISKCQPEEVRDQLMDLAKQWYRIEKVRDTYIALYDAPDEIVERLEGQPSNIRKFHTTLTKLAQSSDPVRLAQALIRVHELGIYLRRYKRMEDWPARHSAAMTVWWFLPFRDES
jgi:hypothetical protein